MVRRDVDGSTQCSAQLLKLLMKRGPDRGYFPKTAKSLFISDNPGQEEAAKKEFTKEGICLNFVSGSWYLGAYLGPQEELEAWVKPQVEAWDHGVSPTPLTPPAGLDMPLDIYYH